MRVVVESLIGVIVCIISYYVFKHILKLFPSFKSLMNQSEDPFVIKLSLMCVVIGLGQVLALSNLSFLTFELPLVELISVSLAMSIFLYKQNSMH